MSVFYQQMLQYLSKLNKTRLGGPQKMPSKLCNVSKIQLKAYSYFKKHCRKKSKKSSSQDHKVMWFVSNPSFAGKQSLH